MFPLWDVHLHMIPRVSNPFVYLNLFGIPRDEEGRCILIERLGRGSFVRGFRMLWRRELRMRRNRLGGGESDCGFGEGFEEGMSDIVMFMIPNRWLGAFMEQVRLDHNFYSVLYIHTFHIVDHGATLTQVILFF